MARASPRAMRRACRTGGDMRRAGRAATVAAMLVTGCARMYLHRAPPSPRELWPLPAEPTRASGTSDRAPPVARDHTYSLPELIDLAEAMNPDTRIAWEQA